jgi:hypothetical protein
MHSMAKELRFRDGFDMPEKALARDELWKTTSEQRGFVTAQQSQGVGVGQGAGSSKRAQIR